MVLLRVASSQLLSRQKQIFSRPDTISQDLNRKIPGDGRPDPPQRRLAEDIRMSIEPGMYVDVAIVGGGPAGLAVANAVRGQGVTVKVFESTTTDAVQGSAVLMNLNGQAAVEAIDPNLLRRMEEQAVFQEPVTQTFDQHGNPLPFKLSAPTEEFPRPFSPEFKQRHGRALFVLGWHEIRQTLREALPKDMLVRGAKVTGYSENESHVNVHFQDGREDVGARILVGADGYQSRIRAQLRDDPPPVFAGRVMWRARLPRPPGALFNDTAWWRDGEQEMARFIAYINITADSASVVLGAPIEAMEARGVHFDAERPRLSVQEDSGCGAAKERCLRVFEDFDPRIVEVIKAVDPATFTEHGLYFRSPEILPDEGFGHGRVTLVGDAVHMGPPNGLGLNLALEDAAVLGHHLRVGGLKPDALRRYEMERVPRIKDILRHTKEREESEAKARLLYQIRFPSLKEPLPSEP